MKSTKKLLLSLSAFLLLFSVSSVSLVFAHGEEDDTMTSEEKMEGDDQMMMGEDGEEAMMMEEKVNSFEVFWPIVAGKTRGDSLYFLKGLKETLRGWIIFGAPQKADYEILLGTKRVIEAEKLINEGDEDNAVATFNEAINHFGKAKSNIEKAKSNNQDLSSIRQDRLHNLSKLIPQLSNAAQSDQGHEKSDETGRKVKELLELF